MRRLRRVMLFTTAVVLGAGTATTGCAVQVDDGEQSAELTSDGGVEPDMTPPLGNGGAKPFVPVTGGAPPGGGSGGAPSTGGGTSSGGTVATGGAATGGVAGSTGGASTGGTPATGGAGGAFAFGGAGGTVELFPPPVDVTTLPASASNPAECPDVAPENPVGDCLGLPIYLNCVWGDERRTYSCVCDWYHWLCI